MTAPDLTFASGCEWTDWAAQWALDLAAQMPDGMRITSIRLYVSGRDHITLDLSLDGRSTTVRLDGHRQTGPIRRAEVLAEWLLSDEQQRLFDEADEYLKTSITVERASAVAAATRIDGATFRAAVRRFQAETKAQLKKGKPNITTGHSSLEIESGLTLKRRNDGSVGLTLREDDHQMTNLTFTPKLQLILPDSVLNATVGRRIEDIVDKPFLRGSGLIVSRAWSHGGQKWQCGGTAPSRTCFELASDPIPLETAVELIDGRRADA